MNLICTICSELLTGECVSTHCGHVFHALCIDTWFRTSQTCPMDQKRMPGLIKLFFEVDDSKESLNLEDILKTNDDLSQKLKQADTTNLSQQLELQDCRVRLKESNDKIKLHERIKQLDDMALAGFKSLKLDSMKEIAKLNAELKNLKLDLLAERQLRRIHQQKLREFEPNNENYNSASVIVTAEDRSVSSSFENIEPSLRAADLSVEAKPMVIDPKPVSCHSPEIPNKIMKSTDTIVVQQTNGDQLTLVRSRPDDFNNDPAYRVAKTKRIFSTRSGAMVMKSILTSKTSTDELQKGRFRPTTNAEISNSATPIQPFSFNQPSTSNVPVIQFSNNKPVSFGDGPAFPAPMASLSSSASTSAVPRYNFFKRNTALPSFSQASQEASDAQIRLTTENLRDYRESPSSGTSE